MPHFFLVLSVNGSRPYSLGGGNDSVKSGISAGDFSSLRRVAAVASVLLVPSERITAFQSSLHKGMDSLRSRGGSLAANCCAMASHV